MSHVRAIALVPTTDDPTGSEVVVNPASSAGRPLEEVKIEKISMIGIIPLEDEPEIPLEDEPELKTQSSFFSPQAKLAIGSLVSIAILVGLAMWSRSALPEELVFDAEILEAELFD